MLRCLEKITSLKNLACARPGGQIATLLMLVMVGVLVMIMVTVNLGKVSNTATALSNAADSAALYLASQLATKSTQLYQGLGYKTEKCQKGGFLSLILAIIVAIIFVAIAYFAPVFAPLIAQHMMMTLMVAGAIGGAIGGAAGGAIAGTGVLQGALQGAMIGAAIGSAASAIATAMAPATTSMSMVGGTAMDTSLASQLGLIGPTTTTIAVGPAGVSSGIGVSGAAGAIGEASGVAGAVGGGLTGTGASASGAVGGASATGSSSAINAAMAASATTPAAHAAMLSSVAKAAMNVLGVGAKFYNESVDQKMSFAAISAAAKSTQNLPELDRYRENVFLQALSQTVDDPRDTKDAGVCQDKDGDGIMKCDPYDSDGDGNKKETVPYFQYWWDRRMEAFKSILPDLKEKTDTFVNTTLENSKNKLDVYKQTYSCESGVDLTGSGGYMCTPTWTPGSLYRYGLSDWKKYSSCNNIEDCKKDVTSDPGENGTVIAVAEAMVGAGHKLDFYKKTKADMRLDYGADCEGDDCGELQDEVEVVTLKLMEFVETVKDLQKQGLDKQGLDKLTSTWQTWSKLFYNEELDCQGIKQSTGDYYDQFQSLINGDAENGFAGIQAWRDELKDKKKELPKCKTEQGYYCTDNLTGESRCSAGGDASCTMTFSGDGIYTPCDYFSNAPCKMTDTSGKVTGYTIDSDTDDEFDQADSDLADLISAMDTKESGDYQDDMNDTYKSMAKKFKDEDFDYGGINPVTYRWSDSRCKSGLKDVCDVDEDGNIEEDYKCHRVEVRASDFKIPWIDEEKSGGFLKKKVCMVLKDYCSDPNKNIYNMFTDAEGRLKCENSNNPVWVNISRKEAGNQDMGILGKWNFTGNDAQDGLTDACGNVITTEGTGTSGNSCSGVDCSTVKDTDDCACYCFKQKNSTSKTSRKSTAYFIYRPRWDTGKQNKWVGLTDN